MWIFFALAGIQLIISVFFGDLCRNHVTLINRFDADVGRTLNFPLPLKTNFGNFSASQAFKDTLSCSGNQNLVDRIGFDTKTYNIPEFLNSIDKQATSVITSFDFNPTIVSIKAEINKTTSQLDNLIPNYQANISQYIVI
jgi:hypothetical protein